MNQEFQELCKSVCESRISTSKFLAELKLIGDFSDDLLEAMNKHKAAQDWSCLFRLIFAVQEFPSCKFTPLLCDLLDNYKQHGYSENIVDALYDIRDERCVPSLIRALDHYEPGDEDRHFNKKVLYVLARIGTDDAIKGLRLALQSPEEQIRETAEDELARIQTSSG